MSDDGHGADEADLPHDLRALSSVVQGFMDERHWGRYHTPKNVAAALAVEAAELQEIYLWREPDDPCDDKRTEIEDEAADVLLCLLNFCNRAGVDLGPALLRKLDKAAQKYPVEKVRGRREKYDEY
ncbi:MAG: nucleotide pyrophosphohydrolase [Deltaproteobacteria bacterium]|nr:nucleotide pyrophosphohydrolase [Deltaproteobacteria bacterium]